ncbi:hypothetical protein [Sphingomonas xinjiangensis]|uniref:Lipoprotein n=1 Tax=Sphingomonas xinjiangensis TaxID=643568 RepID=A0A840YTE0_9SPHN|nr:hypothetical protein [Sphingomonas xinjiangensis]MBB5712991.1 hypothetical protein [Sphingomonas xinjiangensis]
MRRYASFLSFVLVACGGEAPDATAALQPAHTSHVQAQEDYADCRDKARGGPSSLIACADAEIAHIGRKVDSPEAAAAFRAVLQQLGDAAATEAAQAEQVIFADSAVRLAESRAALLSGSGAGDAPRPSSAPILSAAWARSRDLSCREHPVPQCAARYDALLALLAIPKNDAVLSIRPAPPKGLPLPTCAQIHSEGKVGGALADAFYARYPKDLAGEQSVEMMPLDAAGIDNVVRYLACVAGATDYDPVVVENGLALFASERHGPSALRTLDALSKSPAPAAGAARRLQEQVTAYLQGAP